MFPMLSGTYWFITIHVGLILFHPFINLIISSLTNHSLRSFLALQFALLTVIPLLMQTSFFFQTYLALFFI